MNQNRQNHFTLPSIAGKLLSLLPVYPGSLLFASALNVALKNSLPQDVRHTLKGKRLCIHVRDAQLAFHFCCDGERFAACQAEGKPDLLIAASAQDFLLLARRQEDPDTLFFSRRLIMEGDTELGLLVKNTLDAIEFPPFDPSRLLARFQTKP
ncbi:MAG: SCP2 sterol-binding domain-containing protein [Proteobacteria bacterium]|nr:SCP2 sterol-binding domain-containing protein [Pseudomonadota bacterium]